MAVIAPGATIGILGGGQLGRMLALAAAPLGYRTHIYCPEPDCPAAQVSAAATVAGYDDEEALAHFAATVDVVTCEFENIPLETATFLDARVPVRPNVAALRIAQDRLLEKTFAWERGLATTAFEAVDSAESLAAALRAIGTPAVLKTRRLGYDGKGQVRIDDASAPAEAWAVIGQVPAILEAFVTFTKEVSVVAARGLDGGIECYVPVENRHVHHILQTTIAPARLDAAQVAAAEGVARTMLESLDYVGVLAVELFVTGDDGLLVNEIAPRVHNSGHWTIEGCPTSQFEQHIRAICGLPLGSPARLADAVMENLLGDEVGQWPDILADGDAHLHLYGKGEARPGRKMGHVTRLRPRRDD